MPSLPGTPAHEQDAEWLSHLLNIFFCTEPFLISLFFFFNLHRKQKNPFCWICFWSDSLNATRCYKILNIFHFRLIEATDTIEHNLLSFKWKRWKMGITLCPPSVCLRNILARGISWCMFKFLNYSFTSF